MRRFSANDLEVVVVLSGRCIVREVLVVGVGGAVASLRVLLLLLLLLLLSLLLL